MNNEYDNQLMHYGVLGMKWGVHRSRKYANRASKAKAKGTTEKFEKYDNKSKAIRSKHERLAGKSTLKRADTLSTGKAIVQSMAFGTYGALKYNQIRSKGVNRGKAAVNALLHQTGNLATGGWMSVIEPRLDKNK